VEGYKKLKKYIITRVRGGMGGGVEGRLRNWCGRVERFGYR
jgi:hypothetical protein